MREFLKEFLKALFIDRYFIFIIGFACGIGIGFYHVTKAVNRNYERGYLEACKDFYKGKIKYDLVKNEDGTVEWKKLPNEKTSFRKDKQI
jgi:hypothetical protein